MSGPEDSPLRRIDETVALRRLVEGTAAETGERFFAELVRNLAGALGTRGAWITEYAPETKRLVAHAFWLGDRFVEDYEYDIRGTPCEPVVEHARVVHIPDRVVELYPDDPDLPEAGAVSYLGAPLTDTDGRIVGHLAVLDDRPMPMEPRLQALFDIFAARAAAELRRLRAEQRLRAQTEKLTGLVDGAMDAILELDAGFRITHANPAATELLADPELSGRDLRDLLTDESRSRLEHLAQSLRGKLEAVRAAWIPEGLEARAASGESIHTEATLSLFERHDVPFFTLILRDVNDRLAAERAIRGLTAEAQRLREELRGLGHFDEIVGESPALMRTLEDVERVASTDATVLVHGETGTGKELVARAIHRGSTRANGPLVVVNCACVPPNLMESEFFGHAKGAFTGASEAREGRFALADGGTIFLDEIGELSLDLQAKLLRVLQEGELQPVGSSVTRRVDVRVVAATHRDLAEEVREGRFREDLYYRLNVFPISLPPLREREGDISLLAESLARHAAARLGRRYVPLTPDQVRRLCAYSWPGNVRELQNVVERALILSRDGRLELDRALPGDAAAPVLGAVAEDTVLTAAELRALERENLVRALERTGWKVSGPDGAARVLGMNASTLASRMRALDIVRP